MDLPPGVSLHLIDIDHFDVPDVPCPADGQITSAILSTVGRPEGSSGVELYVTDQERLEAGLPPHVGLIFNNGHYTGYGLGGTDKARLITQRMADAPKRPATAMPQAMLLHIQHAIDCAYPRPHPPSHPLVLSVEGPDHVDRGLWSTHKVLGLYKTRDEAIAHPALKATGNTHIVLLTDTTTGTTERVDTGSPS